VRELDENITPYVLAHTPPVLTVGYRCMELGYTFIWPTAQEPYFIRRPDGLINHLTVENYITYLVPNAKHCKPRNPSGTRVFCSPSKDISTCVQSGAPDRPTNRSRPTAKIKKSRAPTVATPSDSESAVDDDISRAIDLDSDFSDPVGSDDEQSSSDDGHVGRVLRLVERYLREAANSFVPFVDSQAEESML